MTRLRARVLLASGLVALTAAALAAALASPAAPSPTASAEPSPSASPSPSPSPQYGDERLARIVASLVGDDASELARRFAGVSARKGELVGGPVGLQGVLVVDTANWTSLLGPARRSVHAIVKDPREPFPWWQQPAPPFPQAAVFSKPRDHDVVLVVGTGDERQPWRFSIADGRIVDVVIDIGRSGLAGLIRRLGYLTPSPDDQPGSFVVLPPQEMRPPPAGIGFATGKRRRAPVSSPTVAPDGRTGDAAIDAVLDSLARADPADLAARYGYLAAREEVCDPGCDGVRVPPGTWARRLASSPHSLYAVYTGDPADADVLFTVDSGGQHLETWRFGIKDGRVGQLDIYLPGPGLPDTTPRTFVARGRAPDPAHDYERFYVLPPVSELPKALAAHPLSVRTGDAGTDALLSALGSRDADAFLAALADPSGTLERRCSGSEAVRDRAYVAGWAREVLPQLRGIHAVVKLPEGYQPRADHLVVAIRQIKPYWWDGLGILEKGGKVVGLMGDEWSCPPESIYPVAGYLVPPPEGGRIDPARRSGIAVIDALLDAAQRRDEAALAKVIDYTKEPCGPGGAPPGASRPQCPAGMPTGTPVEILPIVVCEGGFVRREDAPRSLIEWLTRGGPAGLYAVVDAAASSPAPLGTKDGTWRVVVATQPGTPVALGVGEAGVSSVRASCGPLSPEAFLRGTRPAFLLPPP